MSEPIPEGTLEWWDDVTRTYYERQSDGAVASRPYNDAENAGLGARLVRETLVSQAVASTNANKDDLRTNNAFLALSSPNNVELMAQVQLLTRQNSRQARALNGLIRLVLNRLESTAEVIT
ncbi:hypothetical protein HW130_18715 [Streptomyces sp. PKU-EA00015]|uniref:hypothetical protein n=1 Tax=Streptomyces sp. PKU-EA00015 TaxID=2748326 RepID=UPI0015A23752|nr:hypothetical protein [Streptomyces sp. PKU-EA00015]NWF28277.1 hypothetical protein [Streptomyces sp. PKU-EA00015]